jgi:hypothetical protein
LASIKNKSIGVFSVIDGSDAMDFDGETHRWQDADAIESRSLEFGSMLPALMVALGEYGAYCRWKLKKWLAESVDIRPILALQFDEDCIE